MRKVQLPCRVSAGSAGCAVQAEGEVPSEGARVQSEALESACEVLKCGDGCCAGARAVEACGCGCRCVQRPCCACVGAARVR